jgi:hypothetical protein
VWLARVGGNRLPTTRRRLLGQAAIALALSLVVGACWGEESQPGSRSSTGAARLHRLELTSEIQAECGPRAKAPANASPCA